MDRSRTVLLAAGVISLAASLFAVGAAVSSEGDNDAAAPAAPSVDTAPAVETAPAVGTAPAGGDTAPAGETAPAVETGPAGGSAPTGDAVAIEITGFEFIEGEVTITAGTTVTWTNNDGFDHTIAFADGVFPESPTLGEGDTFSLTFAEPGTYPYVCGIHPRMTGTIVVEA